MKIGFKTLRFACLLLSVVFIFSISFAFVEGKNTYASSNKASLTLMIDKDTTRDGIEAVAKKFEKKYGVTVKFEIRPGGAEGENLIRTRLAAADMADLSYFNSGALFLTLNPVANFVDLSKEPWVAKVYDVFKDVARVNGKIYQAPISEASFGGWLYNKKVYQKLGLSIPKTWDELMKNCEKIKKANIVPVIGAYKDSWTSQVIHLADYYNVAAKVPDFATKFTNNKAKYATTPAMLRSFQKLQDVYKKGYLNKDFMTTTYDKALKMLADGTGAHYPMLSFALAGIAANFPDKINDIGFFAQPSDSAKINGITVWLPGGVSIYKGTKNLAAAKNWISYFLSEEGLQTYMTKQKPTGPFLVKGVKLPNDIYPAVKDALVYFNKNATTAALEFVTPVKGPNLPQICVEIGSGMITPQKGAQMYDKDVEKQARQLGLAGW